MDTESNGLEGHRLIWDVGMAKAVSDNIENEVKLSIVDGKRDRGWQKMQ